VKDSRANFRCPVSKPTMTKPLLEVFRKDLADQITFLGSDLIPTAMTALKPAADKLNGQGDEVLGKIDAANAALRAYLDGLKASQS